MLRRLRFGLSLIVCICAILAFALPMHSGRAQTAPAALAAPPLTGGPDAFGYTYDASAPFEWQDTSGGAVVPSGYQICRGPYAIGFTFSFYGVDYTQFWVSASGALSFGGASKPMNCEATGNTYLPNPTVPNNAAYAFWDGLSSQDGGVLRYKLFGAAPNRYLVFEWRDVWHVMRPSERLTFQAIFYEGSNDIKYQYLSMQHALYGDGRDATIGLENADGAAALQYCFKQEGAVQDGLAILFRYPTVLPPTPGGPVPLTGGPDAFGYTWDRTVPFEWIDARDGVPVPSPQWNTLGPYSIGFDFNFYGGWYDELYIGPGYIGTNDFSRLPTCIPSQGFPNGFLAPLWGGVWFDETAGHVFCKLVGSAPNREFVVAWYQIGTLVDSRPILTFEVVLFEGSNDILFQYQTMGAHPDGDGGSAAIGIEDVDGKRGLQVSCRQEWITDGSAVRIRFPTGLPTPTATLPGAPTPTRTATPTRTQTPPGGIPLRGGPDAFGYTYDRLVPFEWIDATDGTMVPWISGQARGPFPIGFTAKFYEEDVTEFHINNGMLGTSDWSATPMCIPSQGTPNGFVAAFWDSLKAPEQSGHLYYKTVGEAPNRKLVVEWYRFGTTTVSTPVITFEIILCEGSNDIWIQYLQVEAHPHGDGANAVVGIEDREGKRGLSVSCRQGWIEDAAAVRFYYPSSGATPTATSSTTPTPTSMPSPTATTGACPDILEPNDSFAQAAELVSGQEYSGAMCTPSDVDYYRVDCTGGQYMLAQIYDLPVDLDMEVYGPDLALIWGSQNPGTAVDGVDLTVTQPGYYYMRVYGKNGAFDAARTYHFKMTVTYPTGTATPTPTLTRTPSASPTATRTPTGTTTPAVCPDRWEPNDTLFNPPFLISGYEYTAAICSPTDVDYYGIDAGGAVRIRAEIWDLPVDLDLELYGPDRTLIARSSQGVESEAIDLAVSQSGFHYMRVYGRDGAFDTQHTYSFRMTLTYPPGSETPTPTSTFTATPTRTRTPTRTPTATRTPTLPAVVCPDRWEPNDSFAQAYLVTSGWTDAASICSPTDSDYFAIDAQRGDQVRAEIWNLPVDLDLELYGPDLRRIAIADLSGTEDEFIDLAPTEAGRHYFRVFGKGGAYDLSHFYWIHIRLTREVKVYLPAVRKGFQ